MAKKPIKYTAIPRGNTDKAVSALSTIAETLIGAKGNGLEKAVTFRDLENLELVSIRRSLDGRNFIFDPIDPGAGADDDVVTPTQPTNFQAIGGFTSILLTWDYPTYPGHSFTEIWRAETNVLGSAALLVGTNSLNYSDIPGNNFSGYYWIRHVNVNNTPGPFNDTAGTLGETAEDVAFNLDVLNGRIADIHLNSLLSDKIDLVQVNADAVAALDELVDNNKIATDSALNTINTVTIPNLQTAVGNVTDAIDDRVSDVETITIPNITQQITDINNTFPSYATLAYSNSTFLNSTGVNSAISGRLDTFLSQVIEEDYVSQALLTTSYRTEADTDTAISQSIATHFSTVVQPSFVTQALLTSDYRTEAATDSAITQAINTHFTTIIQPDFVSSAFLQTNYLTETQVDGAISDIATTLRSEFTSGNVTTAYLEQNYRTEANTDTAIAQAVQVLRAEVNSDDYATNATLVTDYRTEADTNVAISSAITNFLTNTITPTFATTAFLQTNYLTETQTDSAISTAITDLMTNTIGPDYATTAFITTNYRTESATDSAISSALTNFLSTTISPTYATSAFLTNNYRTETNTDTAIATQVTGLRSEIFNGTGTALQSAFVSNLDSAISNAGGSIASSLSSLSATLNSPTTGLVATRATVTSNQQAIVNDTGGIISSKIDTYSVTANGQTNTLSQWAQVTADVDDAYELQWGVKGTVAGLTGGIGFYNDGNVTQLTVQSDRFAIIDPRNDQVKSVFTTIVNDPVLPDGVYIDTAFIKAATIQELVAGDVNADTVTAGISITSPNINGGSFAGSSYTALAGSYKFDVVPGSSIPLWFGLAAQSRTISNAKFALQNNGNITARGINIYDNSNNLILAANGNINGAYVNNLSVGTLDIQGNAVTVPVYIETASVLTNGGWTTILDQTITQDIASTIFASFDILTERVGDVSGVYDTIDLKLEMYEGTTTVVRTILFEQLGADQEAGVIARHLHSISGGAYIDATNYRLKITGRSRNASTQPYRFSAKGFSTSAKR